MNHEFYTNKGLRIFSNIFGVIMIAVGFGLFYSAVSEGKVAVYVAMGIMSILLGIYFIAATLRHKIVITNNAVIQYNTFKNKQLYVHEIEGFKINSRNILIVSNTKAKKNIWIQEYWSYKNNKLMLSIIQGGLKDLNRISYEEDVGQIVQDTSIGINIEDRTFKLERAKKTANILNIGGLILALWVYLCPYPYQLAISISLVFPLFVIFYFITNRRIIRFSDSDKKSAYPSLMPALLIPALSLTARAYLDYDLVSFRDCLLSWLIAFLSVNLIVVLLLRNEKNDHRKRSAWIGMLFFALAYSYGGIIIYNADSDYSTPIIYKAKVMDKSFKAENKHIEYNLTITHWGGNKDAATESVTYDLYQHIEKGDSVTVKVKQGNLNIPWYYLDK